MKSIQTQNGLVDAVNIVLMCFFSLTLIVSNNFNSYSILLLIAFNLCVYWDIEKLKTIIKDKFYLLFVAYFILVVFNCIYSEDTLGAIKFLERNVAFIVLPIGVAFMSRQSKVLSSFLNILIWTIAFLFAYSLLMAFLKNLIFNVNEQIPIYKLKSWFFTYHYLAGNLNISAIYLSLMGAFAAIVLLYNQLFEEILNNKTTKKWGGTLMIILNIGLLLLLARTILAIYILMAVSLVAIYFYKKKKLAKFFMGLIVTGILLCLLVYFNDVLFLRVLGGFQRFEDTKYFSGGFFSRLYQWEAIYNEFVKYNVFLGFGIGDAQGFYSLAYEKANLIWAKKANFNVHNMYLESLFSTGILGLFILISIFGVSLYKAIKFKNMVYLFFIIIFCAAGLTESLLNRQQGIIFFLFINFLFYYNLNKIQFENSNIRNQGDTQ